MPPRNQQNPFLTSSIHDSFSLVSISLSESLPSSIGSSSLPSMGSISPKLPHPGGMKRRESIGQRRGRSSTRSRWKLLIPRHLPLWSRWTIILFTFFMVCLQGLFRATRVEDRRAMLLKGKAHISWALTRLKPQKIAIYCGQEVDFDVVNSLITAVSLKGIKQRTIPSIYALHEADLERLTFREYGQAPWIKYVIEMYTKPLSLLKNGQQKQEVILVPPSRSPLDRTLMDILRVNHKTRAVFVIKDPRSFITACLVDPHLPAFENLIEDRRISFLLLEKRQMPWFIKRMSDLIEEDGDKLPFDMAERVRYYTPLLDVPSRRVSPYIPKQMLHYGVFISDNNKNSINHVNTLISDFTGWIKRDLNGTGYDIILGKDGRETLQKITNRHEGPVSFHVFFPPHMQQEEKMYLKAELHVSRLMKKAVFVHSSDSALNLYATISKMSLLLPSHPYQFPAHNATYPDAFEPIVPIGLSTRSRILLPHSLAPAYNEFLDLPELITYPDDPKSTKRGVKASSIMQAVIMIKEMYHPRLTMAKTAMPWVRYDREPYWSNIREKVDIENINAFAEILSM